VWREWLARGFPLNALPETRAASVLRGVTLRKARTAVGYLDLDSEEGLTRVARSFRYRQVGRCVNGVVHDVNNYLGAILAYGELVSLDEGLPPESRRMVTEMVNAVNKCSALIGAFTGIARKETRLTAIVDPIRVVEHAVQLRSHGLKMAQIAIETKSDEAVSSLAADQPRLTQALLGLLINAEEALEGVERPRIRATVCEADGMVVIAVWNSAPPIPEEDRTRVFDRFFTTKNGDHLGLGLPFARDIARTHRGDLVYSPDRGFEMRLPARAAAAESA